MRTMREYDLLLAVILLMVFGLLGYHYGQTLKDTARAGETSQQAFSAVSDGVGSFGQ